MYKIIGGDKKEYGPVSAEQVRQWLAEGRANGQTQIQAEGTTEWKPLSMFPEFADLLGAQPIAPIAPPVTPMPAGLSEEFLNRDYDLDIGQCIANGWDLLKNNFGLLFGGTAIFFLIQIGLSGFAQIPFVGLLFSLASLILSGPLTGGLYFLVLKTIRREPAEIGDVFAGFRIAFGQLLLGYIVAAILIGLSAVPGVLMMVFPIMTMVHHNEVLAVPLLVAILGFVIAMVPAVYLGTCWKFTLALIVDKRLEFWPAMSASRRMVGKHWWLVFGLTVVVGLINMVGFLACCVGIFFTMPIAVGALMYAYESIFSPPVGGAP